jgi:hypothetical protein
MHADYGTKDVIHTALHWAKFVIDIVSRIHDYSLIRTGLE